MSRNPVSDWQELSALYEQADGLTEPALGSLLARLKTEQHPMFDQLQRMLSARAQVRSNDFLGALPALHAAPGPPTTRWLEGSRIGPYRLLRKLGAGGMAEVWLAQRDDGAFQRQVAIKLMFRHADGPAGRDPRDTFTQRFARERDIVASLHHPHIAALHDAGVTPTGQPWLALEYVEGEPLTAWCDGAQAGLAQRMRLFRQVLLAVQHAHANLVIHRDLKPANILVTTQGEVRLLDFGIAKLMEPEGGALDETELTRQAGRPLTVQYASPEQVAGRPLTTACDVYSLGVVLYELLCGERPYELKVMSAAMLEQAILDADPREPSRRALTDATARARGLAPQALRRALSPELDAIALRCLAKQPAARYSSVDALLADVDRWLAGEAVLARAPGAWYRFGKFALRHRLGVGLGVAGVAALAATATVAVVLGLQARSESARALAARDFMMGMFKQADSDKSRGADLTARELLDRGREDVTRRLSGRLDLQADLLSGIAGIQFDMQEYTKADLSYQQLVSTQLAQRHPREAARAIAARADNAFRMGNDALAASLVAEGRKLPGRPSDDLETDARLDVVDGWLALQSGEVQRAKELFASGRRRAEAALGPNDVRVLDALSGQVRVEAGLQDFDAALAVQAEIDARSALISGSGAGDKVQAALSRIDLLYRAGRFHEALVYDQSELPRCVSAIGPNHSWCQRLAYYRALLLSRVGSNAELRTGLPAVETLANDKLSPDLQVAAQLTLFRMLFVLDDSDGQRALASSLVEVASSGAASEIDPVRKIQALQLLAERALRQARWSEAESLLTRAGEQARQTPGPPRGFTTVGGNETLLGAVRLGQRRYEDALVLFQQAQGRYVGAFGASHPLTQLNGLNEALALEMLGRREPAAEIVDRAEPILRRSLGDAAPAYQRVAALRTRLRQASSEAATARDTAAFQYFN